MKGGAMIAAAVMGLEEILLPTVELELTSQLQLGVVQAVTWHTLNSSHPPHDHTPPDHRQQARKRCNYGAGNHAAGDASEQHHPIAADQRDESVMQSPDDDKAVDGCEQEAYSLEDQSQSATSLHSDNTPSPEVANQSAASNFSLGALDRFDVDPGEDWISELSNVPYEADLPVIEDCTSELLSGLNNVPQLMSEPGTAENIVWDEASTMSRAPEDEDDKMVAGNPKKMFVSNIDYKVTEKQVKEFFKKKFGQVRHCHLIKRNNRSRGRAFVIFKDLEAAQAALEASREELTIRNRSMHVEVALQRVNESKKRTAVGNEASNEGGTEIDDGYDENKPCEFERLTDHCLMMVFSHLSVTEALAIERVCVWWRSVCLAMWKSRKELRIMSSMFGPSINLNDYHLSHLLRRCKVLHTLDLYANSLTNRTLANIGKRCPSVKILSLSKLEISNKALKDMSRKVTQLEEFTLRCNGISEKSLWYVFKNNRKLRVVDLSYNCQLSGQCFHVISPTITTLILNSCTKLCDVGLKKLSACANLEELQLNQCLRITARGLEHLEKCVKLKVLHMKFLIFSSPGSDELELSFLQHLVLLEVLVVQGCLAVGNNVLRNLSFCTRMRHLNLQKTLKVTEEGFRFLRSMSRMEFIDFSYLTCDCGDVFEYFRRMPNLTCIIAKSCHLNGSSAVSECMPHWPRLKKLNLTKCTMVNVPELLVAAQTHCRTYDRRLELHIPEPHENDQFLQQVVVETPLLNVHYERDDVYLGDMEFQIDEDGNVFYHIPDPEDESDLSMDIEDYYDDDYSDFEMEDYEFF